MNNDTENEKFYLQNATLSNKMCKMDRNYLILINYSHPMC